MSEGIELHEWRDEAQTDRTSRSFQLGEYFTISASRTYIFLQNEFYEGLQVL